MLKTVYISGPMRGHKQYNFPAFDEAAIRLFNAGWRVISPAELDRQAGFDPWELPDDHDWSTCDIDIGEVLIRDCEAIRTCDAIAMLDGWQRSGGAQLERAFAIQCGLTVLDEYGNPLDGNDPANPKDAAGPYADEQADAFDSVAP